MRIKLVSDRDEKLQAFCSVTFNNDFVVRDLKIISGTKGPFIAMPSRKLMDRCNKCGGKNHLRAQYCNDCGTRLDQNRAEKDKRGRARLHTDIAHPINSNFRENIQNLILDAFEEEVRRSKEPGYTPINMDEDFFDGADVPSPQSSTPAATPQDEEDPDEDQDTEMNRSNGEDSFEAGIFN
jgi:stage V sporulation protein G